MGGMGLLLLLFTQVGAAQPTAQAGYTTIRCIYPVPLGLQAECGLLRVPENHADPTSPLIALPVLRVISPARNPAPDPLVHLVGGPGGSSVPQAARIFPTQFAPFARQRDVIFVDQRGTGFGSPRLHCQEVTDNLLTLLTFDAAPDEANAYYVDLLRQCRERLVALGADLSQYNSSAIAQDLEALRVALGYEAWNLIGVSYGSRLALTLMRDAPQGLRSVILDSVYPPQVNLYAEILPNAERALSELFAACEADADCREHYPDLAQTFNDLYAQLNAEPRILDVDTPDVGRVRLLVDGDRVYNWVFDWLYAVRDIRAIPRRIAAMAAGRFTEPMRAGLEAESGIQLIDLGMHYSVQCAEDARYVLPEDFDAVGRAFPQRASYLASAGDLGASLFDLCAMWGVPATSPKNRLPVISDVPTLLLAGRFDPITPPAWANQAAETLSRHYLYELPTVGHGVVRSSDCGMALAVAFLADPTTAPDAACLDALPPIRFHAP